jgi:hypothetical protein
VRPTARFVTATAVVGALAAIAAVSAIAACAAISGLDGYAEGTCPEGCADGAARTLDATPATDGGAGADGAVTLPECTAGLLPCADGCVDPSSAASCGSCGNRCTGGTPFCAGSGGTYACTASCPSTAPTACANTCVDLTSNARNCASCGNACTATAGNAQAACIDGACAFVCGNGFILCSGECVSVAAGCATSVATSACAVGGCNEAAGACTAPGQGCHCTQDSQCGSGKCVLVSDDNDISCGTGCTGSGTKDGFDCVLASPGIPASPAVTGFGYAPSNFTPSQYAPPSTPTTVDCNTTYDSSKHAFTGWCSGQPLPTIASSVVQAGGPNVDILAFSSLTIDTASTLTITGSNAVILAVYGNATLLGTIHADGAVGTSKSTTAGASGPGGGYKCSGSTGTSQGNDDHCSGGAGAGASTAGGDGAGGVGGRTAAGGTARANASRVPLYGGCPGGSSGSWACQTSGGGGGGAVQVSAAGTLSMSGTITAHGGNGGTSTCFAGGCGAKGYGGGGGGAGSGGAILLEGQTVSTSGGTLEVGGGQGGDPNTKGGGGTASGGTGGSGGTIASTTAGAGTGATSDGCGPYTDCGGGGGGGYGYLTIHTGEAASAYSCTTPLSPAPMSNPTHTACLCVWDSNCSSGKCVNANAQCTGSCTGTGVADSADCQLLTSAITGFTCSTGNCNDVASPTGTCTASGVPCWCTNDAQCPNGACAPWAGCMPGACTGSGTADGLNCVQ